MIKRGTADSGATFSDCERYRYSLWRTVGDRLPAEAVVSDPWKVCVFIGLNPSTADETVDDPTIRRCIGFAKSWKCDELLMLNLFAVRATDPKVMKRHPAPIGPDNDWAITNGCNCTGRNIIVVCAWGNHGNHLMRGPMIRSWLMAKGVPLHHLGLSWGGMPKHPLYLKSDLLPVEWK